MSEETPPNGRIAGLIRAAQLLRPRTIARLSRAEDKLREEVDALTSQVRSLQEALDVVTARERQLRTMLVRASDPNGDDRRAAEFDALIGRVAIEDHVRNAVASAQIRLDPFPHCIVDNLLPTDYYNALIGALPPAEFFADRPANKQQLVVPFELAPPYSARVWRHMAQIVAERVIGPALIDKLREPLTDWLRHALPTLGPRPLDAMPMSVSDGRILLRRRGYRIPPHRDPKWGFVTCLLYLARPGDDEKWGTQLFTVDGDEEASGARPHWIADTRCRLVADVEFRPNRALVFVNSVGAHGAQIPDTAEPADLTRYAYQFRVGPTRRAIERVMADLTPDQRALWAGKTADY